MAIPTGDLLQAAVASVGIAFTYQSLIIGIEPIARERTMIDTLYLWIFRRYFYLGLSVLPFFCLAVLAILFSGLHTLLIDMASLMLSTGWILVTFAVFDIFTAVMHRHVGAPTFKKLRPVRGLAKRIALFIGILLIYFGLVFGPYLWNNIHSTFLSKQKIIDTSAMICLHETDMKVKANKIADWLQSNVKWDTTKYRILPFYWRKERPSPDWVMSVRRGACEESAVLFAELARISGIESRLIFNPGEDHVWNEIWTNGSWVHFDATLSEEDRFDDPGLYERSKDDGGWGKQLSYVYAVDLNGTINTVTNEYTDTGNLVINVKKNGVSMENVRVTVKSMFLMEANPDIYKTPLFAVEDYANQSGCCSFYLGKNNYTVIAQIGDEKAEKIVSLSENTCISITMYLARSGNPFISLPSFPTVLLPILTACSIVLFASAFTYFFIVKILANVRRRHELKVEKLSG